MRSNRSSRIICGVRERRKTVPSLLVVGFLVPFHQAPSPVFAAEGGDESRKVLTLHRIVRYEHRLVNAGDSPADMEMFVALPRSNARQKILHVFPDPTLERVAADEYGNRIAFYLDRDVPPGDVVAHGWIAEVEISCLVCDPGQGRNPEARLPRQEREIFLRDGERYLLASQEVSALARELAADSAGEQETVRRIFEHLIRNIRYERDDVWDPAPVVLERRSGSCSEYNFAFMALCRAAGIPARYTGGVVLKSGRETKYDPAVTEDAVFHRWSEVFLNGLGWFPVDCSRASGEMVRYGNPDNYYGRLPAGLLQCVSGDGAGDSPLGWDYLSNESKPFETRDWAGKVGFWISGVPRDTLETSVALREKMLREKQDRGLFDRLVASSLDREILFFYRNLLEQDAIPELVEALLHTGHPEAVYWSLLNEHRGVKPRKGRQWRALCGEFLAAQIEKHYEGTDGKRDLFTFEYWWRKARPAVRWDEEKGVFVLLSEEINIY